MTRQERQEIDHLFNELYDTSFIEKLMIRMDDMFLKWEKNGELSITELELLKYVCGFKKNCDKIRK